MIILICLVIENDHGLTSQNQNVFSLLKKQNTYLRCHQHHDDHDNNYWTTYDRESRS